MSSEAAQKANRAKRYAILDADCNEVGQADHWEVLYAGVLMTEHSDGFATSRQAWAPGTWSFVVANEVVGQ